MAADPPMRASDADRERVVEILREQVAEGRLTFEEFEERIERAYAARTWDELRGLTDDLPVRVVFAADEEHRSGRPERRRPAGQARRAGVSGAQILLPVVIAAVVLGAVAARAYVILPLLLIGAFCFAGGSCGRRGHVSHRGAGPHRITPPPGR